MTGVIKRISSDRGFGFLKADGVDHFYHRTDCTADDFDQLQEGDQVTFDAEATAKGPRARNVAIASRP